MPPLLVHPRHRTAQRLFIDAIDADQPIEPVQVDAEAVLGVPEDPAGHRLVGGWRSPGCWSRDGRLRRARGQPEYGKGPLSRAKELAARRSREVVSEGGTRDYVVDAVRAYEKVVLPWEELFDQDLLERMILITCGGDFDAERRSYRSNIVVFFSPA